MSEAILRHSSPIKMSRFKILFCYPLLIVDKYTTFASV